MPGRRSKQKGARGEREWRDYLRVYGYEAIRGRQYSGGDDSPDVKTELDGLVHFEVKRVERLSIHAAMAQATEDAPEEAMPVVAHKRNRGDWLITLNAGDFLWMLKQVHPPASQD